MNRDEFSALPLKLALETLWDSLPESCLDHIKAVPKLEPSRAPKWDTCIYRKDGITWASEYDLEGLRFWHKRSEESAASGGQYAEKDEKTAKALGYWITWRGENPAARWTGERNREQVTAKPPLSKPEVYPRDGQRAPAATAPMPDPEDDDADNDPPF